MESEVKDGFTDEIDSGFRNYVAKRIIVVTLVAVVILWALSALLVFPGRNGGVRNLEAGGRESTTGDHGAAPLSGTTDHGTASEARSGTEPLTRGAGGQENVAHDTAAEKGLATDHAPVSRASDVRGVLFIRHAVKPLRYELEQRWFGWRPNDILPNGDNVENFQLGVLEVTRRTATQLAERLSRTGSQASMDPNLEQAMNWFMVKAGQYWFPSPENKYADGLAQMEAYQEKLKRGQANFYIRADNLIPLLAAYEDLLGGCDENLVKKFEENGSAVSWFKADDYFYYAQGVASAMLSVLEAVDMEFSPTIEARHGGDLLDHAIHSCERATTLDPLVITDSELDGILANHRANMAAPISHARFYLAQLIKTLST
ncbi:MAG: DUF2333 family protein [Desulfatibacillaceae bacterium]